MNPTDVTTELQRLATRVEALEAENSRLRSRADATAAPTASVSRRGMLRMGGAAAAAATGVVFLRPAVAGATPVNNLVLGTQNDGGTDKTELDASTSDVTLLLANTGTGVSMRADNTESNNSNDTAQVLHGGLGRVMYVNASNADNDSPGVLVEHNGIGEAIVGWVHNSDSGAAALKGVIDGSGAAIWGQTSGHGPALRGVATGLGYALQARITDTSNVKACASVSNDGLGQGLSVLQNNGVTTQSATYTRARGTGAGIHATSEKGEGGKFEGKQAQVRLVPAAGSHPVSGSAGQLFVDHSNNLYFCKGGTNWVKLA